MSPLNAFFKILEHTLSIVDNKESRKYLDIVIYLKKAMYEEENKGDVQNRAIYDNAWNELCIITASVAELGKSESSNK
jgi:hypothetical protein